MINRAECEAAGFPDSYYGQKRQHEIELLAKRLERAAKEAKFLGVDLFAGSGKLTIRSKEDLILADVGGPHLWDGGDGGYTTDDTGLLRGERIESREPT